MSVFREVVRSLLSLLMLLPVLTNADTTPSNVQELFKKACVDVCKAIDVCSNGWTAFEKAFSGKNWNDSMNKDYDAYFSVFPLPTNIKDKALLWTGTDSLQTALTSRANLTSSANIVSIMIINRMATSYNVTAWCGNANGGIDYSSTNCPSYTPGTPTPVYTFYATFSYRLAKNSAGVVFFLTENTFRNTSIFAQVELPRLLINAEVTKIVVLNVYKYLNGTCNQTTSPLHNIKAKAITGGKAFSCVDVYGDASLNPPSDTLLTALTQVIKEQTSKGFLVNISGTTVLCVILLLTTILF